MKLATRKAIEEHSFYRLAIFYRWLQSQRNNRVFFTTSRECIVASFFNYLHPHLAPHRYIYDVFSINHKTIKYEINNSECGLIRSILARMSKSTNDDDVVSLYEDLNGNLQDGFTAKQFKIFIREYLDNNPEFEEKLLNVLDSIKQLKRKLRNERN
jgi:hypothetical protein